MKVIINFIILCFLSFNLWSQNNFVKELKLGDFDFKIDTFYKNNKIKKIVFTYCTVSIPENFINKSKREDIYIDAKSGYEISYFENGKIEYEGSFVYACRIGIWLYYNLDGTIKLKKYYNNLDYNNIASKIEVL